MQLGHFLCYRVSPDGFKAREATVADQFGTSTVTVLRRLMLCNPVRKNGDRLIDPEAHLVCYEVRPSDPAESRRVFVTNQFEASVQVEVRRAVQLCLPSAKSTAGGAQPEEGSNLDHFQCHATDRQPLQRRRVRLQDQFGKRRGKVLRLGLLCAPARKDESRVTNRREHLACYRVQTRPRFKPRRVRIFNQFERAARVGVMRTASLCLPSVKETVPPLPDLRPTVVGLSVSCTGGQGTCTTAITYEVTNLGSLAAGPFDVLAQADPALATQTTVNFPAGLPPGGSTGLLTVGLGPASNCFDPDCTVAITADPAFAVLESNEGNNLATLTRAG